MKEKKQIKFLQIYSLLVFFCGCISLFELIRIPSYAGSTGLFGYSPTRLLVIAFLLLVTIGFLLFVWYLGKGSKLRNSVLKWIIQQINQSGLYTLFLVMLGLIMIFSFVFFEYFINFPENIYIAQRILPVFLWFVSFYILSLMTLIIYMRLYRCEEEAIRKIEENGEKVKTQLPGKYNSSNTFIGSGYLDKILDIPLFFWVIGGFLAAYILFYIPTVFLNSKEIMLFPEYVPAYRFIGLDLGHMRNLSETRLIDKIPESLFPPFTLLFFSPLLLTSLQTAYKVWVIIILLCYFLTAMIIPYKIYKTTGSFSLIFFIFSIGLFSYGLQFELERGQFNLVTFALCMLSIYIFHYKYKYRYLAYILLAVAINLKLWPAIFIFMFVNNWSDWKGIIKRFSIIFGFSFVLFFVMGYQTFLSFINFIYWFIPNHSTWVRNTSITGYVYQAQSIEWIKPYLSTFQVFYLIIFCLFFFAIIYKAIRQRETYLNPYLLLACTIGALIIPTTTHDYRLSILAGPIVIVLIEITSSFAPRKNILTSTFIFLTSLAFSSIQFSNVYKPKLILFQNNFPALMVILFLVACLYYMRDRKVDIISKPDILP